MIDMKFDMIIDAENEILGRVAGLAAKKALLGNTVAVVNCSKALISGNRSYIVEAYLIKRKRGAVRFPSVPQQIVKRTIRGMVNYKSGRGAKAFDGIKCFNLVPKELEASKKIKLGNKNTDLVTVAEMGQMLKDK